ncbi:hypothetical protein [Kitasatospora sp. NBC_01300]|uniref:hypothetical protein n=1 Tax=Kitasatospora sp. NBC_01300 TaxID=2903574 RepID=UPI00352FE113|nr:hypothetical protein OG556_16375 [Kitasatospora sp. NBC_01300]
MPRPRPYAPPARHVTGQDVFVRERPWTPPAPFWCTVTAYYRFGQPITLWSGGAGSVRLAVKVLRERVEALADDLGLPEGDEQLLWLDAPSAEGRAADDLAKGRSHAIAITHGTVVYIINATRAAAARAETGAAINDLLCSA